MSKKKKKKLMSIWDVVVERIKDYRNTQARTLVQIDEAVDDPEKKKKKKGK